MSKLKEYFKNESGVLYHGKMEDVLPELIAKGIKVDAIITDPPFGSVNGMILKGQKNKINWDNKMDWNGCWKIINKIIKNNGNIILFNQMPYSVEMINPNIKNFSHEIIWVKNNCASGFNKNTNPLRFHENIYCFRNKKINNIDSGINYNQMDKKKYNRSVIHFSKDMNGHHPTQKPLKLMEYLVKTYTNQGDLILDFTSGSGSTILVAYKYKRRFIGIEMMEKYAEITKQRFKNLEKWGSSNLHFETLKKINNDYMDHDNSESVKKENQLNIFEMEE